MRQVISQKVCIGLMVSLAAFPVFAQNNSTVNNGGNGMGANNGMGNGQSGHAMGGASGSHASGNSGVGSATGVGTTGNAALSSGPAGQVSYALQNSIDRLFVLKSAQGNAAEVLTGNLAQRKSRNEAVRQLAQHLVQQHGSANAELLQLARQKGFPLPASIGTVHAAVNDQLTRLSGAVFDQTFLSAQIEAHEATIMLYQQEIAQGTDPDVRAFASRHLPDILSHTAMIYNIARAVGAPAILERPQALLTLSGNSGAGTQSNAMAGGANSSNGASNNGGASTSGTAGTGVSGGASATGGTSSDDTSAGMSSTSTGTAGAASNNTNTGDTTTTTTGNDGQ